MAKYTTDYNLKKPDANEHYNVDDQNGNMDNIEAALKPTADPALIPSGLTGKINEWVSWITNRIKAITGKANWYDAPATTLETANTHMNAAAPHEGHETIEGAQAKVNALAGIGNTKTVKQLADEAVAHLADNTKQVPHLGTTTNIGNDYSITTTETILANQKFTIAINAASTGASTLNISTIGTARGIKKPGGLDANLKVGVYTFFHDRENFQLLGEGGEYGTATADDVISGKTIGTDAGIVTGTGINAKRFASGITIGTDGQFMTISGLSFRPSVVIAWVNSSTNGRLTFFIDSDMVNVSFGYSDFIGAYLAGQDASSFNYVMEENQSWHINNDGFTILATKTSSVWNWVAYE